MYTYIELSRIKWIDIGIIVIELVSVYSYEAN